MERCAACGALVREAAVVCRGCGRELPLRIVVVSEGSRGGGFALVVEARPAGREACPARKRSSSSRGEPPARPEEEDDGG